MTSSQSSSSLSVFKAKQPFETRLAESKNLLQKYPDRIPVIFDIHQTASLQLYKYKFLFPNDISVAQMISIMRRRMKLQPSEAVFFFFNNTIPALHLTVAQVYNQQHDSDGFLYCVITQENAFGSED